MVRGGQQHLKTTTLKKHALLVGIEHPFSAYLTKGLSKQNIAVKVLGKNLHPETNNGLLFTGPKEAFISKNGLLTSYIHNVQTIISSIAGSTLFDICMSYRNNTRLLEESNGENIKKAVFLLSNPCSLHKNKHVIAEKQQFLSYLEESGIDYTLVTTNGLFPNFIDFLNMANMGKVYILGDVNRKFDPIHLKDFAAACVDAIDRNEKWICIKGPETLNLRKIAQTAFDTIGKPTKIIRLSAILWRLLWLKAYILGSNGEKRFPRIEWCTNSTAEECVSITYGALKNKVLYFLTF